MSEKENPKDRLLDDDLLDDEENADDIEVAKELLEENVVIIAKNLIKDYEIGDFIVRAVDNVSLRVKGQGWRLVSLKIGADSDFNVSVNGDSGQKVIGIASNLTNNRWILSDLEIIDIAPDTIVCNVEKIVSKKLPVVPQIDLDY